MGIFDALTGDAGHAAAQNQRSTLAAIIPNLVTSGSAAYDKAGNLIQGGFNQARTDLGTGYGAATGAINTGAGGALDYLNQGQQGALGQLGQARGDLTAGGGAYAPLSALASQYGQGAGLYADSLGINGAGGNQRAQSAFDAGPGYAWQRDQGIEALARKANASGQLVGGNADRDAMSYASGLAGQAYGSWQDRLAQFNPLQLQATQGAATGNQANNTTLANLGVQGANLLNTGGQNRAQVSAAQGNSLADLATRYYGNLGGLDTTGANAQAANTLGGMQNTQGLFTGALPGWNDTFKQDAAASNAASANSLKLGMEGLKLAASLATGMPMGGGSASFGGDPTFGGFSLPGQSAASVKF